MASVKSSEKYEQSLATGLCGGACGRDNWIWKRRLQHLDLLTISHP